MKTSLAPGSKVVTDYLREAGLDAVPRGARLPPRRLRLHDLHRQQRPAARRRSSQAIDERRPGRRRGAVAATATSRAASTPTCAPTTSPRRRWSSPTRSPDAIDIDLATEPLGTGRDGQPVFLRDIWPTQRGDRATAIRDGGARRRCSATQYADVFAGDEALARARRCRRARPYAWDDDSTYVKQPPLLRRHDRPSPAPVADIAGARVLALLGDRVTTDHISPAGSIKQDSPAGQVPDRARRAARRTSTPTARGAATTR